MSEHHSAEQRADEDSHSRLVSLLGTLIRLGTALGSAVAGGTAQFVAAQRHEVRRMASVLALSLAAALFACAAAGFAAFSVITALGEEHRVVGTALIAGCFALLSGIAVLLARGRPGAS
jgi:hypothetical protein